MIHYLIKIYVYKGDFSADGRFSAYFDPVANFIFFLFATSSSAWEIYVSHFHRLQALQFLFFVCCYHKRLKRHKRLKNEHE